MAKSEDKRAKFEQIIQIPLLPEHVDEIKAWVLKPQELIDLVMQFVDEGLSFTIQPNHKLDGASCGVMDTRKGSANAGLMFYSNAPDAAAAVKVALYKLSFLKALPTWKSYAGDGSTQFS
jgi:hypothetical protein